MAARLWTIPDWRVLILLAAISASSCATLSVSTSPPYIPATGTTMLRNGSLLIQAHRIVRAEEYEQIFDENLTDAGITAVWVSLENQGDSTCNLGQARWSLHISGQHLSRITSREVLKRYYQHKGIRAYSIRSDSSAEQKLDSISLTSGNLPPGRKESGLVFFRLANLPASTDASRAILKMRKLPPCGQDAREIELVLTDADTRS